jgi:N-acetylmuramoyl-L-alanine amidase
VDVPVEGLPLRPGHLGEAVRDVQTRLSRLSLDCSGDRPGLYGESTTAAVRSFQEARGLRIDGVCGQQTWSALVEAGYRLGDRLLYHRHPMLRGDDVAELQRRLGALGFDAGRVDGIFGPRTQAAVTQFQRNAGLTVDGVCGPDTLQAVERLGSRRSDRPPVAQVRELETLRSAPRTLQGKRVVIGDGGGMNAVVSAVARILTGRGAEAVVLHHPDQSEQAAQANAAEAHVYVGLALDPEADGCRFAHYAGHRYESAGGRRLAEMLQSAVPPAVGLADGGVRGMALPVLKETRMPAVVCQLGPPEQVVARTAELAGSVAQVLDAWASSPYEDPPD